MSHTGKLHRGRKWWNQRNNKGELPEGILNDANKMADVEYYKEFIKGKDEKKVELKLDERKEVSRVGAKRTPRYKDILKQLETGAGLEETKSKRGK